MIVKLIKVDYYCRIVFGAVLAALRGEPRTAAVCGLGRSYCGFRTGASCR